MAICLSGDVARTMGADLLRRAPHSLAVEQVWVRTNPGFRRLRDFLGINRLQHEGLVRRLRGREAFLTAFQKSTAGAQGGKL